MFQPNAKVRKILASARAAYVYPDGVVVWEEKTAKTGKYESKIDVYHVFECDVHFYSSDYSQNWDSGAKAHSLTVFDPKLLISGLKNIRIAYHNQSDAMKERNIDSTGVYLFMPNGMEVHVDIFRFLSGQVKVNPDPVNDRDWEIGSCESMQDFLDLAHVKEGNIERYD